MAGLLLALALPAGAAAQDMIGHGGPVSALAAGDGTVVSGGFDGRVILWDTENATARRVERFHDGNVTSVALVPGGFVTSGQDGRIAHWRDGQAEPALTTPRGVSPVSALAVAGERVAVGFFDGQIQHVDLGTGTSHLQPAHDGRVSGLAFLPDGALVSVGADLRFARWGTDGALQVRAGLPDLPNGLVLAGDSLAVIFAEGALRLFSRDGTLLPERFLTERPLVALAAAPGTVAAASVEGDVWLLDLPQLTSRARIAGGVGPVWALALQGDTLFGGGMEGVIRRWSVRDGAAIGQSEAVVPDMQADGSRGAEVFGACSVCHSLAPGDHSRAGPSLHDIFGRRIASAEGYDFSPSLRKMDIIWTPRTVAELFEYGPDAYTPGSRMPDQRVTDPADRQALVDYLARVSP